MPANLVPAKSSQILALTASAPAIILPESLQSVRSGSSQNLCFPGSATRCRRRFRSFGVFRAQSPQFFVRTSIDSGTDRVFVVATAVSGIAVDNTSSKRSRKKTSEKLVPRAFSSRDDDDLPPGSSIYDSKGFKKQEFVEINEVSTENSDEVRNAYEDENSYQSPGSTAVQGLVNQGQKNNFWASGDAWGDEMVRLSGRLEEQAEDIPNSPVSVNLRQISGANAVQGSSPSHVGTESASDHAILSASDNRVAKKSVSAEPVLPPPVLPKSAGSLLPDFSNEFSELPIKAPEMQIELSNRNKIHSDAPKLRVDFRHRVVSSCSMDVNAVVDDKTNLNLVPLHMNESSSSNDTYKENQGVEKRTFSGVGQPAGRSPGAAGLELSSQGSNQHRDNSNKKVAVSRRIEDGLSHKRKESRRDRRQLRDNDNRHVVLPAGNTMFQLPFHNDGSSKDDSHPSKKSNAYNLLLRSGRLTECVEMLEEMEESGQLDMDKVHHASFFKCCKHQKAVEEAFRFAKLVPNPTLSTFNMLMSVCACSQDTEGALQVLKLVEDIGMKVDCKLYTTLISTCAKSGKVDAMFEVFHEMVNSGVEPNVHTYGALIDGCARAGQVAKAFGAYGIMRSKNVKPDRVVFNALIAACGQSGVVDRAFDVLAEMRAETLPIDPDHVTVGALMKACSNAGQVDRAKDVYKMIDEYNIKGTPEVYTIAVNCASQSGDWEFACRVYSDMQKKSVVPDEVFFSALIDVAGHSRMLDVAFEILKEAKTYGSRIGIVSYSSLMGACSNAKNWQKALELYEKMKSIKLQPSVSTMNALITALCEGDQLPLALKLLAEMKSLGLSPNAITYSMLLIASERKDEFDLSLALFSHAKEDGIAPNLMMYRCIIGMCLRRYEKACALGEPVFSFTSGRPHIENRWTSLALMVYREMISGGTLPSVEVISQVLGCLRLPRDISLRNRLVENAGLSADLSKCPNFCSVLDGFGEYDLRAFSLLEEAASMGILPCVSFKNSPIIVDTRKLHIHTSEVYLLAIFKALKHRLAAGAKLPSVNVVLPVEETQVTTLEGVKNINLSGRISQALGALLRRMGLPYQGNESYGKIRINGATLRRWFRPKLASRFSEKPEFRYSQSRLGRGISDQQRIIRTGHLSLE